MGKIDVFLSHNSADKAPVKAIAEKLRAEGLRPWLDEWELRPGLPWQPNIEAALESSAAVAVFVGPDGFGPWERLEMRAALSLQVEKGNPVIPVALPGMPEEVKLPLFLAEMTWVSFFEGVHDPAALSRLVWGITGQRPEPEPRPVPPVPPKTTAVDLAVKHLAASLRDSHVTYFVGRSVYASEPCFPPNNTSLTRELLQELGVIKSGYEHLLPTLDVASTCYALKNGDKELENKAADIIVSRSLEIPPAYQNLASLLKLVKPQAQTEPESPRRRIRGGKRAYQLIVTTNLDVLLERAFVAAGLSFSRIVQLRMRELGTASASGASATGATTESVGGRATVQVNEYHVIEKLPRNRVLVQRDGEPQELSLTDVDALDEWIEGAGKRVVGAEAALFSNLRQPILYKHHGSQDIVASCVLSTAQCMEFVRSCSRPGFIPADVERAIAATPALFLGYHPLDADLWLLHHALLGHLFQATNERRFALCERPRAGSGNCFWDVEDYLWDSLVESMDLRMRIKLLEREPASFLEALRSRVTDSGDTQ